MLIKISLDIFNVKAERYYFENTGKPIKRIYDFDLVKNKVPIQQMTDFVYEKQFYESIKD